MKSTFRWQSFGKKLASVCFSIFVLTIFLLGGSSKSFGYDNDTHFWLTYYTAIKAGYTPVQATQIASADVSVDFDSNTEPLIPHTFRVRMIFTPFVEVRKIRYELHALPPSEAILKSKFWNPNKIEDSDLLKTADELVEKRKVEFWQKTLTDRTNPGVFIHFLQDTFSHRGFSSYIGHASYYYVDFLSSDRTAAKKMALETYKYLAAFRNALSPATNTPGKTNPANIVIDAETEQEIMAAVDDFSNINPSSSIVANIMNDDWNNLDEVRQSKFVYSLDEWSCALLLIKRNAPSPNSRLARREVARLLKVSESDLPNIWLFDLKNTGAPNSTYTDEALVYGAPLSANRKTFTYADEAANYTPTNRVMVNSKKQCLQFNVAESVLFKPFDCR